MWVLSLYWDSLYVVYLSAFHYKSFNVHKVSYNDNFMLHDCLRLDVLAFGTFSTISQKGMIVNGHVLISCNTTKILGAAL